jgi:SP family arabinose:H+ symporter-like MFS transporter
LLCIPHFQELTLAAHRPIQSRYERCTRRWGGTLLNATLLKATLVAALGGLLFGLDTAVISGTTKSLTRVFHLSPAMLGVTVSSALLGTIVGASLAGWMAERYGRRDTLRLMAVLYVVSAFGCAFAWNWDVLLLSRVVGGLGIGGSSVLAPMYISEIAPPKIRGALVSCFQLNIVGGILLAYFSNFLITLRNLGTTEWRWQFGVAAIPSLLFLVLLFAIPRSPRWLVKKGRIHEAAEVLLAIGSPNPQKEIASIASSLAVEDRHVNESVFGHRHIKPLLLAASIAVFSQFSGINAVLYYLNEISAGDGVSKVSEGMQTLAVGMTNLVFTALAMYCIDRLGRRFLLMLGSAGMSVSLFLIAWVFRGGGHNVYVVVLLIIYCASFSFSIGAVLWVYISEIFPNAVRAKGLSFGSLLHWVANALISGAFPSLAAHSRSAPFFIFGGMMAMHLVIVYCLYPETKQVSLEHLGVVVEGALN